MQLKAIYFAMLGAGLTACGGGGSINNIVPGTTLKTPSMEQMKTAATLYLGTTEAYDGLINTNFMIIPHYEAGFKLDDICTGGGTASLIYQDNDDNQLVTKGDTYQVEFNKCVTDLETFASGSISSTVDVMPLILPELLESTDWKISQTLTLTDLKISKGTITTTNNGKFSVTADNKVATNQYHASITSSYLNMASTDGTSNIALAFDLLNFDYTYNRNTLFFKMDNDISLLYSINGKEQSITYTTDPLLTGTESSTGQGIPTAGQLIMNLADYKPVTLIPQTDGKNVSVDIADDGLNAVLMTWASLGLAASQ